MQSGARRIALGDDGEDLLEKRTRRCGQVFATRLRCSFPSAQSAILPRSALTRPPGPAVIPSTAFRSPNRWRRQCLVLPFFYPRLLSFSPNSISLSSALLRPICEHGEHLNNHFPKSRFLTPLRKISAIFSPRSSTQESFTHPPFL